MKVRLKAIMLIGLLVLIVPLLLGYVTGTLGASHQNVKVIHSDSKSYNNSDCIACHTTLTETSRDTENGNNIGAHRRHFLSVFLNFANNYATSPASQASKGCSHCHQNTVMDGVGTNNAWTSGSGTTKGWGHGLEGDNSYIDGVAVTTAARKQVDPTVCRDCHGSYSTAPAAHTTMSANAECESCHNDVTAASAAVSHASSNPGAGATGVWGIDQRYANSNSFCVLCHGGQAWFLQADATAGAGLWP